MFKLTILDKDEDLLTHIDGSVDITLKNTGDDFFKVVRNRYGNGPIGGFRLSDLVPSLYCAYQLEKTRAENREQESKAKIKDLARLLNMSYNDTEQVLEIVKQQFAQDVRIGGPKVK